MMKTCNETVYDSDVPPPAPPKPKRVRPKKTSATTTTVSTQQSQIEGHAQSLTVATTGQTTSLAATPVLTNSPATNTRR